MNIAAWLDEIGDGFTSAIMRYPLTFLFSISICFYLSSKMVTQGEVNASTLSGLIIGGLSTIVLYNFAETLSFGIIKKHGLALSGVLIAIVFYYLNQHVFINISEWKGIVSAVLVFSIGLSYLLSPYLKNRDDASLQRYLVQFLENFAESLALSLILYLVLIGAISGIDLLFEIDMRSGNLYAHMAIWISGFFMPLNFLSHTQPLPLHRDTLSTYKSRFFKILILYIGIPVALIYGLIILGYVIKYIITDQYKEWTLSMFTWFLGLGLIVYLLNKVFVKDTTNEIALLFDRYFPFIGILLSLSYAWICYISISSSGLTTSYYFMVLFSFVSLAVFSMVSFWKGLDYRYIYILFIGTALFSILSGPLDCHDAPLRNQTNRLMSFLKSNNRYDELGYKYNEANVDQAVLAKVSSGINQLNLDVFDKAVRKFDKSSFLKDTMPIGPYELFKKLGIEYNNIDNGMIGYKSVYHEVLPSIKFDKDDEFIPVLNAYAQLPSAYNGSRASAEGSLLLYNNGLAVDSINITIKQMGQQLIKTKSVVKSNNYDIYIQNLSYETIGDRILIRDFLGMMIKKNKAF